MNNRFRRKLSFLLTTSTLALSFAAAGARPARAQSTPKDTVTQTEVQNALPGHSYWTHPDYDGVLDVWNCPERGICARVHSINADDPRVRKAAAKTLNKNPDSVTTADVMKQFCGYEAQFGEMKQSEPGHWEGKIWIASHKSWFGVELKEEADGSKLHMRGYLLGFFHYLFMGDPFHVLGKGNDLNRVQNPPPACVKPAS